MELAFVAALQHLTPIQRATLLLRELLDFSARDAAQQLDTSIASITSALQRARKTFDELAPDTSHQQTLRELDESRLRGLAEELEIVELDVTAGGDVAYAEALLRCGTEAEFAVTPEKRLRLTLGLRKEDGRWIVAHEHHSFTAASPSAKPPSARSPPCTRSSSGRRARRILLGGR